MSLADCLLKHADTLTLLPSNRIKCSVTAHEMKPDLNTVKAHLEGQKYQKALKWYNCDFSQYKPFIVEHKSSSKHLYCTVTKKVLNKIPEEVKVHFEGGQFNRLLAEFKEKQLKWAALADKQKKKAELLEKYSKDKENKAKALAKSSADDQSSEDEVEFWVPPGFRSKVANSDDLDESNNVDYDEDDEDDEVEVEDGDDDDVSDDSMADLIDPDDGIDESDNDEDEDGYNFDDVYESDDKKQKKPSKKSVQSDTKKASISTSSFSKDKKHKKSSNSSSSSSSKSKSSGSSKSFDSEKKRKREDNKSKPEKKKPKK